MKKKVAGVWMMILIAAWMMVGCGEEVAPTDSGEEFARTLGLWRRDGAQDTASIVMDGEGGFSAYYADGALEVEGYLEYVDEYGDGNGRYDMYDASGEFFEGFYFDSDTQFHIGNDDGIIYIRDDGEYDSEYTDEDAEYTDTGSSVGALVNVPGFTGLTSVEVNNDYHGGYYYQDITEDSRTVIVNTAFEAQLQEGESPEDMITRNLELVEPQAEAREVVIEANEEQTARLTYPVYYVTWFTGGNEDTQEWIAMAVLTDGYMYVYGYRNYADYAVEMEEIWYDSFESIELSFPLEDVEEEALTE